MRTGITLHVKFQIGHNFATIDPLGVMSMEMIGYL